MKITTHKEYKSALTAMGMLLAGPVRNIDKLEELSYAVAEYEATYDPGQVSRETKQESVA